MLGNILLDLVVVFFVFFGFYYGWRRGFLRIVLKTFSGLFSAVIAMSFFGDFGVVLKEKYFFSYVHEKISAALSDMTAGVDSASLAESVPSGLQNAASLVGIDLTAMAENAMQTGQNAIAEFAETSSHAISQFLGSAAAFLILFVASFFVMRVLSTPISGLVMKIPVLGHINRFLGLLFGALTTLIIAWLFAKLVGFLDDMMGISFFEVKDAWITGLFYKFSLL